jgi:hypothetical protein
MHVDLKFVTLGELAHRTEDPVVVWESAETLSQRLRTTTPVQQALDLQWIEDRFWTWVHYAAAKLGRGELFEVLDFLAFLPGHVLAPLAIHLRGSEARGVRRLEQQASDLVPTHTRTVAAHDPRECASAILQCVTAYRELRAALSAAPDADSRR